MAKTLHWQPFQVDKPVFVRTSKPLNYRGRIHKRGSQVKWKELNLPRKTIELHYNQRLLMHDVVKELENTSIGDGLEVLDVSGLHSMIDEYNKRIEKICTSKRMFDNRKIKKSKIAEKQRGILRHWRHTQEDWLVKAEEVK